MKFHILFAVLYLWYAGAAAPGALQHPEASVGAALEKQAPQFHYPDAWHLVLASETIVSCSPVSLPPAASGIPYLPSYVSSVLSTAEVPAGIEIDHAAASWCSQRHRQSLFPFHSYD